MGRIESATYASIKEEFFNKIRPSVIGINENTRLKLSFDHLKNILPKGGAAPTLTVTAPIDFRKARTACDKAVMEQRKASLHIERQ